MLFEEYGCESMLLPVPAQKEQIRERIAAAKNAEHSGLKARIRTRADALQNKTKAMWEQVDDVLDLSPERA
jgi:hypothetical protein